MIPYKKGGSCMKKIYLSLVITFILSIITTLLYSGCNEPNKEDLSLLNSPIYFEDIPKGCIEIDEYKTSNSCGFVDENGKTKVRIYSSNIYTTQDNALVPINSQLSRVNDEKLKNKYCYKTNNSYITTYFPSEIGDEAIYVSWEYDLFFMPISNKKSISNLTYTTAFIEDRYVIEYQNAFDNNSRLYLYATPKGYNQEVIFKDNSNVLEYSFQVSSNDLYCELDPSGYILIYNKEYEEINGIIQRPLIKDADNRVYFNCCRMNLEQNDKENKYTITYSVSEKNFKYPISIVNGYSYYEDRQADTQIDSQNSTNEYLSDYAVICNSSNYGKKELCVKFPYLEKLQEFGIEPDDIESAVFTFFSISSGNTDLSLIDIDSYWCSSLTNKDTKMMLGKKIKNPIEAVSFSEQNMNITSAIRKWGENSNNWDNGLMISAEKGADCTIITTSDSDIFNNFIELTIK